MGGLAPEAVISSLVMDRERRRVGPEVPLNELARVDSTLAKARGATQ